MHFMKRSIRTRLFVTICLISVLFLLLFGAIYNTYYDDYVVYRRQQQLYDAFSSLQSSYHGDVAADLAALQDTELQYSIRMLITNRDGYIKYNSLLRTQKQLTQFFGGGSVTIFQLIDQLPRAFGDDVYFTITERDNSKNTVLFSAGESSVGVQFIGLLGVHKSGDMVLLQMPSPVISSSGEFTSVFLLAVGAFCLALSLVVAYFLSRRFTRPVLEIRDVAEHMADLDFSSRYCGPVEDEIGELGISINRLSGHLEKTISALRETNLQLEEEIDKARRLDEMRRNLLINVSHELKTPLALIQGYAEGLRLNLSSDAESRDFYCSVIEDETRHMTRMVSELLSVSRIEAGTTAPQPESFSLDEMLDEKRKNYNVKDLEKMLETYNENVGRMSDFVNNSVAGNIAESNRTLQDIKSANDQLVKELAGERKSVEALAAASRETSRFLQKVVEQNDVNEAYIFEILDKWAESRKVRTRKK